eukprot:CAMPEP_0171770144 /NCGR_PEP_ID=MMETSP0991-20121206/53338_1 /TAXON_ID=483369 /ORGANISM="non described non described, Strain CCMP2098" /LENGTH=56 /DNA_ID=CAMNT_0012375265 /DNA_START=56 /DNA_END=223 /DNA_ORIENTATION=+
MLDTHSAWNVCLQGRVTVSADTKLSRQMAHSSSDDLGAAVAPAASFVVRSAGVRQK